MFNICVLINTVVENFFKFPDNYCVCVLTPHVCSFTLVIIVHNLPLEVVHSLLILGSFGHELNISVLVTLLAAS
jgi:hypothetical protein